jgi:hypothetical protein
MLSFKYVCLLVHVCIISDTFRLSFSIFSGRGLKRGRPLPASKNAPDPEISWVAADSPWCEELHNFNNEWAMRLSQAQWLEVSVSFACLFGLRGCLFFGGFERVCLSCFVFCLSNPSLAQQLQNAFVGLSFLLLLPTYTHTSSHNGNFRCTKTATPSSLLRSSRQQAPVAL